MTTRQQEIIDNLVNEFNKLETTESKSFNLINTAPLLSKTRLIEKLENEQKLSLNAWEDVVRMETRRIVELLSDDLPTLDVFIDGRFLNIITIKKYNEEAKDEINIYVGIRSHYEYNEEATKSFYVYDGLEFSFYISGDKIKYNTIEELLADKKLLEKLRKKLN
jgi:hypothetical protein